MSTFDRILGCLLAPSRREHFSVEVKDRYALIAEVTSDAPPEWRAFFARCGARIAEGGAAVFLTLAAAEPDCSPIREAFVRSEAASAARFAIVSTIGTPTAPLRTFRPNPHSVIEGGSFAPQRRRLYLAGGNALVEVDLDRTTSHIVEVDFNPTRVAATHDSAITIDGDGVMHAWSERVPKKLGTARIGTPTRLAAVGDCVIACGSEGAIVAELGRRFSPRKLVVDQEVCGLAVAEGRFALGLEDGTVHIFDASGERQRPRVLPNVSGDRYRRVEGIAFLPDGCIALSMHAGSELRIEVWTEHGERVFEVVKELHGSFSVSAAERAVLLGDARTLVVGGPASYVTVWDLSSRQYRGALRVGDATVDLLADGDEIITVSQDGAQTFALDPLEVDLPEVRSVSAVRFVGDALYVIDDDGVEVFDRTGVPLGRHPAERPAVEVRATSGSLSTVAAPDGRWFAVWGNGEVRVICATGPEAGRQVGYFAPKPKRRTGDDVPSILGVTVAPDGEHVHVHLEGKKTIALRVADGAVRTAAEADAGIMARASAGSPIAWAVAPDGSRYARAAEGSVKIYDAEGRALARVPDTHASTLAFSPDGQRLYLQAGELQVFDLPERKLTTAAIDGCTGLMVTDASVASWGDRELALFSPRDLQIIDRFRSVDCIVDVSHDGANTWAIACSDHVCVVERRPGSALRTDMNRAAFEAWSTIQRAVLDRGMAKGRWTTASNGTHLIGSFDLPGGTPWGPLSFDDIALSGVDASALKLPRTSWVRAAAPGASFADAELDDTLWAAANLAGASFQRARLQNASFEGANLREVDFRGADLRGVCFDEAKLYGAKFDTANLDDASFRDAKFDHVSEAGLLAAVAAGHKVRKWSRKPTAKVKPLTPEAALVEARRLLEKTKLTLEADTLLARASAHLEQALAARPPGFDDTLIAFVDTCWENWKSTARALPWLQRGCELGILECYAELGWELVEPDRFDEELADPAEGIRLLEHAAAGGHVDAMAWLGRFLHAGSFCPRDDHRARLLLEKAAEMGQLGACVDLARWLASGELGPPDWARVHKLYTSAYDGGFEGGAAELAIMYILGEGVERDEKQAQLWYKRARELEYDWSEDERWKKAKRNT